MPIIQIQMLEGRSQEVIAKVIENVALTVSETLEVSIDRVRVVVTEVPKTHWGIGTETVDSLGRKNDVK